jgi:hypothetical protein
MLLLEALSEAYQRLVQYHILGAGLFLGVSP